ncbi:MAG: ATP-dependent helicase [Gammaproteobacteria bacterium]|nr:ATP-dependent helicase [Gammaproteobacteria bacterium]
MFNAGLLRLDIHTGRRYDARVSGATSDRLNPAQAAAAQFERLDGSGRFTAPGLLVIAGAGTGKTSTLAHRVAHLVRAGVDPARILLLTFTRRAAVEMTRRAERIAAAAPGERHAGAAPKLRLPWSGTFHSVANRLLREHALRLGLAPQFTVLDRGDATDLMDVVRHELGLADLRRRFPRKDTCVAIHSRCVNSGQPLEDVLARDYPWCAERAAELRELFRAYVARKLAHQALDYDDLLLCWCSALQDPALARAMGARFDQVLVDEYQDVNALQAQIVFALKPDGAGVTAVGDDAQAIYSFRGAAVDNILDFPARCTPAAAVIVLERNYRSCQPILDTANALLAGAGRQYRKALLAVRGGGRRPRLVTLLDEQQQAAYVVQAVLRRREEGTALRRQAVLFRSASHSDRLEVELLRADIPFVKYGGLRFLEAAHVKDLLALLRWADNPHNGLAAFRVLQLLPGMGPAHADRCWRQFAAAGHRFGMLMEFAAPPGAAGAWPEFARLLATLGGPLAPWPGQLTLAADWYGPQLERRYDAPAVRSADLAMLGQVAAQYPSRERFLTELALDPPQASGDLAGDPLRDEDYLVLSTVHSAKGQEWDAVHVLNVSDGNFPSEFATDSDAALDEERRLLYVAMTRARDELHLLEPLRYYVTQQPPGGDGHVYGARSRFLGPAVLATLEQVTWGTAPAAAATPAPAGDTVTDVQARLRALW